ncbi:hypothetical protein [Methylobacter tundripaludum]|uniref:hypothetical protein n=1 Tax=Methylobacter tundripaludum TaxID=173365 RepID=UPI0004DFA103|nr:hypothetical protein [Methylobacter tundripaludum]
MSEKQVLMRFNPNESRKLDDIIRGSYDDFVHAKRRNLFAVSMLILFFIFEDLPLVDVRLWGVNLPQIDIIHLLIVLDIVCLYFSTTYLIYAYSGYRNAKLQWRELLNNAMRIGGNKHRWSIEVKNFISTTRYYCWLFLNYIFPFLLGVLSTMCGFYKIVF